MSNGKVRWSRRDFLKTAGAAGLGTVMASVGGPAKAGDKATPVPTRPFGNTGIQVPILGFGGSLSTSLSPLLLRQAVINCVTYWDTAHSYMGGKSEKGIGKYFEKFPEDRRKIFLVTKSWAWSLKGMADHLDTSLERMNTDYMDLFFTHGVSSIDGLDKKVRTWAEKATSSGKIRLFGFSTHSNMEECLLGAAKLGWIDGIMMTYNYRLMQTDRMRRAVDACAEAGIGLTAMKTQGGGPVKTDSEAELRLAGRFLEKGFTEAQAKLKAVWENPQIASICSEMPNTTILAANADAARDRTQLSTGDRERLDRYARESRSDYCAGCTRLCESAVSGKVPIGDVMRYLMYCRSYGDRGRAEALFRGIPERVRTHMAALDYGSAERRCPQHLAIGKLMREASEELG